MKNESKRTVKDVAMHVLAISRPEFDFDEGMLDVLDVTFVGMDPLLNLEINKNNIADISCKIYHLLGLILASSVHSIMKSEEVALELLDVHFECAEKKGSLVKPPEALEKRINEILFLKKLSKHLKEYKN